MSAWFYYVISQKSEWNEKHQLQMLPNDKYESQNSGLTWKKLLQLCAHFDDSFRYHNKQWIITRQKRIHSEGDFSRDCLSVLAQLTRCAHISRRVNSINVKFFKLKSWARYSLLTRKILIRRHIPCLKSFHVKEIRVLST